MNLMPAFYDIRQPAINIKLENTKKKNFKIDKTSIAYRTLTVALGCFGLILFSPSIPMVCAGGCFSAGYYWFEKKRAQSFLNAKAIDLFNKSNIVPEKVIKYLSVTPEATRQLCQQPAVNLGKVGAKKGKTLLEIVAERFYKDEGAQAVLQEIEINQPLTKKELHRLFVNPDLGSANAILLLERRKITPADFTSDHQLSGCLNKIRFAKVLESMRQHGFKLDFQDNLISAILRKKWRVVSVYLQAGVQLPELKKEITILDQFKQFLRQIAFGKYLEDNPRTFKILKQLQEQKPLSFSKKTVRNFAFLKPAVWGFRVDGLAIEYRTAAVAFTTLCSSLAIVLSTLSILPILAFIPTTYLYYTWEWSRATRLLNKKTIEQFQSSLPKAGVLEYIARSDDVELINKLKGDLRKLDENEDELYDWVCKPYVHSQFTLFKKIVDNVLKKQSTVGQKLSYLIKAIEHGEPEFVEYLFKSKIIKTADFSELQQFECLVNVADSKTIEVLKKHGFNMDARKGGITPLLHVAQTAYSDRLSEVKFTSIELLDSLLKAGANINATADSKSIFDLCKDEHLNRFLRRYTNSN